MRVNNCYINCYKNVKIYKLRCKFNFIVYCNLKYTYIYLEKRKKEYEMYNYYIFMCIYEITKLT